MSASLLAAAAANNAAWCDVVCRSHGLPTRWDDAAWTVARRSPESYPDAVTLRPDASVDALLAAVDVGPGCSVKDSFACLDLGDQEFEPLFEAHWIGRTDDGPARTAELSFATVTTPTGLAEWCATFGGRTTLRETLLDEPEVRFLHGRSADGDAQVGAIVNRAAGAAGITNVISVGISAGDAWPELAAAAAGCFPGLPLVGYEHGGDLDAALEAGFSELGRLRIWLRPGAGAGLPV